MRNLLTAEFIPLDEYDSILSLVASAGDIQIHSILDISIFLFCYFRVPQCFFWLQNVIQG